MEQKLEEGEGLESGNYVKLYEEKESYELIQMMSQYQKDGLVLCGRKFKRR